MANRSGRLSELLTPDRVVLPLRAGDKAGALAELTRTVVAGSDADYGEVLGAVIERERALSTGVGLGVAIPHGRATTVSGLRMAAAVSVAAVPWEAADGEPVRLLFLVVGPENGAGEHVKALADIARILRHDTLRERLIDCRTPDEFYQVLTRAEAQ